MIEYSGVGGDVLDLANGIIKEYHPDLFGLTIAFVYREDNDVPENGRGTVFGNATKVSAALREVANYDFVIWISAKFWKSAGPVQRRAALDHLLTHIIIDDDGHLGTRKHDIEEFASIVGRYGFWNADNLRFREAAQMVLFAPVETAPVARTIKDPNKVMSDAEFQATLKDEIEKGMPGATVTVTDKGLNIDVQVEDGGSMLDAITKDPNT